MTAPGPNPSGQCAFIQKMYSTITAHTRSFQAFFCTRATSFLPLTTGRNVGLTATMQQRPSALYHILSNPVNSTPTRRFFIFMSIFPRYPQNRHTSRCACFPYITLYPATRCLLPQNQQIGYCTCRDNDDPADKRCGLPARTTARTAAGTARAETDDTALAHPTATSVV